MVDKYAVVITTINHPTRAVKEISNNAHKLNAEFVIIGDSKSPNDFIQPGATYLNLESQTRSGFKYAQIAPTKHYARKNIGYLVAIKNGATILIETDDDNIPYESFWAPRELRRQCKILRDERWVNAYSHFTQDFIWPRGLPLDRIRDANPAWSGLPVEAIDSPIQQGLADGDPDVDAIYRLLLPLPLKFESQEPIALQGAWCPFNSQNTTWWPDAFPLLYLPYYCSFRMTDIWRSFIAQRIAYMNGWGIVFHSATVFQERNEHNLLRDFEEEVPGYLNNDRIKRLLQDLDLPSGPGNVAEAVRRCYRALIDAALIGSEEMPLVDAWLSDLSGISLS
ncbi:STELLO glycosyltransferase family protein [Methylobacterium organophilum]|nr:STELLO glycosyltransferase family protein [Methylobacterium organophilum]